MIELERPLFFVHIMKTAGSDLKVRCLNWFGDEACYPRTGDDFVFANTVISYLTDLSPERRAETKFYSGHFPFVAVEMFGEPCHTLTIIRDPVDRVVSHLRQVQRHRFGWVQHAPDLADVEDPTLDQLYDDSFLFPRFFDNHQVRQLSMNVGDEPESYVDLFDLDQGRLELAMANLAKVDEVGLTRNYDAWLTDLAGRLGLPIRTMKRVQAAPADAPDVSDELRERIVADNAYDIAFYEFAEQLVAERANADRRASGDPGGPGQTSSARPSSA